MATNYGMNATAGFNNNNPCGGMNGNMGMNNQNFAQQAALNRVRAEQARVRVENQRQALMNIALQNCNEGMFLRFELARMGPDTSPEAVSSGYDAGVYERAGLSRSDYDALIKDLKSKMAEYQVEFQKATDYRTYGLYALLLVPIAMTLLIRASVHSGRALRALSDSVSTMQQRINSLHSVTLAGAKIQVGLDKAHIAIGGLGELSLKQQVVVVLDVPRHLIESMHRPMMVESNQYVPTAQVVSLPPPLAQVASKQF